MVNNIRAVSRAGPLNSKDWQHRVSARRDGSAPAVRSRSTSSGSLYETRAGRDWPLVGRASELETIRVALRGPGAGVLLVGSPGMGRSRLIREALSRLADSEYLIERLPTGGGAAGPAFAAFAHLVGDRSDPRAAVVRALTVRAGGRRVVLTIDDAHLMDHGSAAILSQLVAQPRIVVLAAMRTGHPAPDVMTALWKDESVERLDLTPLTQIEVEELVCSVLDGMPSTLTAHLLWELTDGNVLLLRELIAAGLESSALRQTDGLWNWSGPLVVTDRLQDIVQSHIGVVEPLEQQILDVLAHSERLDVRIVETLFSADSLRAVEARGLLASTPESGTVSLRLFPPLLAQVIRARTRLLNARSVRRKIAGALPAAGTVVGDEPGLVLRRTRLLLDSDGVDDPAVLARVVHTAWAEFDHGFAARCARMAYELDGADDSALLLVESLHRLGRSREASEVLDTLDLDGGLAADALFVDGTPDASARNRTTALRAEVLGWGLGRVGDARALLAAGAAATGPGEARNVLYSARAEMDLSCGRLGDALIGAQTVLESTADPLATRLRAAATAIAGLALTGHPTRALAEAERWNALGAVGTKTESGSSVTQLSTARCLALYAVGWLCEAAAESELRYRAALACGDEHAAACLAALLGRITLDRGLLPAAHRWLSEACLLISGPLWPGVQVYCQSWLAELAALRGDSDRAAKHVGRAEEHLTAVTELARTHLMLARSWLAASRADLAEARHLAAVTADTALRAGDLHASAVAWHTVVRLGRGGGSAPHLQYLARSADGGQVGVYRAHAEAIANADGAALDTVAGEFDRRGAKLLAAEAAAQASMVHRANGNGRLGRAAAATSRALVKSCGGEVRSPALLGLAMPALTPREREIALLAAQGLSSRAIATRLTVSVRTVDNHLQVAYGKLSIRGRQELPGVISSPS